jgi:IclR family acetate operon transcriptional repressor
MPAAVADASVRTIDRATAILDVLAARPSGVALRDVALATGLAPATSHRLLGGLEASGLVRRDGRTRLWQPGPRLARLAEAVQPNPGHERRTAARIEQVAERWDAAVVVAMLTEGRCVCVATAGPPVAGAHLGARLPWHASAAARAILAALPEAAAAALLNSQPRPRLTLELRRAVDGLREVA